MKLYVKETVQPTKASSCAAVVGHSKDIADADQETMLLYTLNAQNNIIDKDVVALGGFSFCAVDLKVVFRRILKHGGTAFILVQNHPSGDATPSNADREITNKTKQAAELLELTFHDHIIIAKDEEDQIKRYSFKENYLI